MAEAVVLTFKYRVKDRSVRKALRAHAFAVNQVWNWCAAQHRDTLDRHRAGARKRRWASHYDLAHDCKGVGAALGVHQQTVQKVCAQFVLSRSGSRRPPRFRKSSGAKRALGWVPFQRQSRSVDGASLTYLGRRYRFWEARRPVPDTAGGGAFVEDARGRWYVCFEVPVALAAPKAGPEAGIDLGLKTFATVSDGRKVEAPSHFRQYEQRLAVAQRAGNKARARAIAAKIANARKDFLHKASTRLVREYGLIVVGNVSAGQLMRTKMAKSVSDAGWSTFRNQLRYKASRHGVRYVEADERMTSQTCSSCGALPPERPRGIAGLGIRRWDCSSCGASHDRDVNAAINILVAGRGVAPRVDESRRVFS